MQNYVNSSPQAQRHFIKYFELQNNTFQPLQIQFKNREINDEFLQFMKTNNALSSIFNCNTSDIRYEPESCFTNFIDEQNSHLWKLDEFDSLDTDHENYIRLESKEQVFLFIQYLELKREFVPFLYSIQCPNYEKYLKQLYRLEIIFKKKIFIKEIAKEKEESQNDVINRLRKSYKSRRQIQRNNKLKQMKFDSSDTKENSQHVNNSSFLQNEHVSEVNFINWFEASSLMYNQFGSGFIGNTEFHSLFKSDLCESEYYLENLNNIVIFDSTEGEKLDLSQSPSFRPSLNYVLKRPIVNTEYQNYFQEITKNKNKIKVYYLDAVGKSYTQFSKNLTYYTNPKAAVHEYKGNKNGYLIQFETSSEFPFTQITPQEIRIDQNNRVLPVLIIHQI